MISSEQLKEQCKHQCVCKFYGAKPWEACRGYKCLNDTRSRPHPAPEVCEEQDACRIPAMCPEVTLAARKAINGVLNRFSDIFGAYCRHEIEWSGNGFEYDINGLIESLRAQQAGDP